MLFSISKSTSQELPIQSVLRTGVISGVVTPRDKTKSNPLANQKVRSITKSILLSCDDKAKIDFGEPGCLLLIGFRGKKTLVPTTSTLRALDHDVNQKGKCINYIPYLMENDFPPCGT